MEGLYLGMDFSFNQSTAQLAVFKPGWSIPKSNGPPLGLWSIGPTIRKDFTLPNGKMGLHTSVSVPLNYTRFNNYEYIGDYFGGVINAAGEQVIDVYPYGDSKVNRRFSVFIRPEVGLFYKLNDRGRISVDAMWGINTGGPLLIRDFHEVIYEGETFENNVHKYNGSYFALTMGYEYRIFK
jgi:hypothetical protein